MPELSPEIEEELRNMSESDWAALIAKVRPPDLTEEYREIAATMLNADGFDLCMQYAKIDAFVTDDGHIDAPRLRDALRNVFPHHLNTDQGHSV